jgi:hypothetical protein
MSIIFKRKAITSSACSAFEWIPQYSDEERRHPNKTFTGEPLLVPKLGQETHFEKSLVSLSCIISI